MINLARKRMFEEAVKNALSNMAETEYLERLPNVYNIPHISEDIWIDSKTAEKLLEILLGE